GMKFYVDENVLIPRPETEELVDWVAAEAAVRLNPRPSAWEADNSLSILDVGTGSGCIAVTLKKKLSQAPSNPHGSQASSGPQEPASIFACDISADALSIAQRNAATLTTPIPPASTHAAPIPPAPIQFLQLDFLDSRQRAALPPVHLLVSNPPYIPLKDKSSMAQNVVGFEPHLALFVEDHDPLIFYRALADFASEKLLPGGGIFVEIHEELAAAVMSVFREAGFPDIILKRDLQGKERMIKATR
ncbi:MAG TPA: HemK/PrmC family methyltransferase, partial [Puia sp.]|nr:HemK/PrmC family methyltransferase [Puia sp.]